MRVRNMKAIPERGPLAADIRRRDGRHAALDELSLVHEEAYVESVRDFRLRWAAASSRGRPGRVLGCGARGRRRRRPPAGRRVRDRRRGSFAHLATTTAAGPGRWALGFNNVVIAAEAARRQIDGDPRWTSTTPWTQERRFYERDDVLTCSRMRHGAWSDAFTEIGAPEELEVARAPASTSTSSSRRAPATAATSAPSTRSSRQSTASTRASCSSPAARTRTSSIRTEGNACPWRLPPAGRGHAGARGASLGRPGDPCSGGRLCAHLFGFLPPRHTGRSARSRRRARDPCAYMPDDPGHADADLAAVKAALAPYWAL